MRKLDGFEFEMDATRSVLITTNSLELRVHFDFGPRILHFGPKDGPNLLKVFSRIPPDPDDGIWHIYGGHRLWRAPEDPILTYVPDNTPCRFDSTSRSILCTSRTSRPDDCDRQIEIFPGEPDGSVRLVHRLINQSPKAIRCALWSLTVMQAGGVARIPIPERGQHPRDLLPNHALIYWPYSDPRDPRLITEDDCFAVRSDPSIDRPFKIGFHRIPCQMQYDNMGWRFRKHVVPVLTGEYPDLGATCEVFVNADMLELETLSPLLTILPGSDAEHTEIWNLDPLQGVEFR